MRTQALLAVQCDRIRWFWSVTNWVHQVRLDQARLRRCTQDDERGFSGSETLVRERMDSRRWFYEK